MEAAQSAMEAVAALARGQAELQRRKQVAGLYFARGATLQALQLSSEPLAEARSVAQEAAPGLVLPAPSGERATAPEAAASLQSIAELAAAATSLLGQAEGRQAEALKMMEGLLEAFRALGDRALEAAALSALASAHVACGGEARDAARAAAGAVKLARELGSKTAELAALEALITTSFALKDPDEALRAAGCAAVLAAELGDRKSEARARAAAAQAHLANEDGQQGLRASFEAAELFRGVGDKTGQASAMCVAYDIHVMLGRPAAAAAVANDIVALVTGDKKAEAASRLMLGSVATASQEALDASKEALGLFRGLGDQAGEAAAQVAVASAYLSQGERGDEGLQAAREALAAFKEGAGSRSGEAAALCLVAAAQAVRGDATQGEKAAREALDIFRDLGDCVGEAYASRLLKDAKVGGVRPSAASLTFDAGCAHIEVPDAATPASLQRIISELQAGGKGANCLVLHLDGSLGQAAQPGSAVSIGMFLMGLRMIGLPVICAIWGKVSGPTWALVLASDYRIAATTTVFMCPVWGKPECLGSLIGHNSATQLCMIHGPKDSLYMLECGVLHQLQKGKEDTRTAATAMARRVAATPSLACRKQPYVLTQAVEEYALAAAQGRVAV